MLILTRKDGESIKIGDDIEIKIVQTIKNGVKIGIEAPKDIVILREELLNEVASANISASHAKSDEIELLTKKIHK